MDIVYVVWHRRLDASGNRRELLIGIYSSRQNAKAGVALVRDQVGFKDHPNGFEIDTMPVDQT